MKLHVSYCYVKKRVPIFDDVIIEREEFKEEDINLMKTVLKKRLQADSLAIISWHWL